MSRNICILFYKLINNKLTLFLIRYLSKVTAFAQEIYYKCRESKNKKIIN